MHHARQTALGTTPFPPLARRYDAIAHKWHDAIRRLGYIGAYAGLIRHAGPVLETIPGRSLSVLDAGAGTAAFSLAFSDAAARDARFAVLDISAKMLAAARARLEARDRHARTIHGRISDAAPGEAPYDVILCAHVIEHCEDPRAILKALRSRIAPHGALLLVVSKPHWCTALLQLWWRHRSYDAQAVAGMLEEAGFAAPETYAFTQGPPQRMSLGYIARPLA